MTTAPNRQQEIADNGTALPRAFPDPIPFIVDRPSIGFGFTIYPEGRNEAEQVTIDTWKLEGEKNVRDGPNIDPSGAVASINGGLPVIYNIGGAPLTVNQIRNNFGMDFIEVKKAGPLWVLTCPIRNNERNNFRITFARDNGAEAQRDMLVRYASSFAWLTASFTPRSFNRKLAELNAQRRNQMNAGTHTFTDVNQMRRTTPNGLSITQLMNQLNDDPRFPGQEDNYVTACVIERYGGEFEGDIQPLPPALARPREPTRPAILDRTITTRRQAREGRGRRGVDPAIERAEQQFQRDMQEFVRRRNASENRDNQRQRIRRQNEAIANVGGAPEELQDLQRSRITFGRAIRRNNNNHSIATYKQVYHELKTYIDLYDEEGTGSELAAGRLRLIYTPIQDVAEFAWKNLAGAGKKLTSQIKKANKEDVTVDNVLYWDVQSTPDDCLFACINFVREHSYGKLKVSDHFNVESTDGSILNIILFMRRICQISPNTKVDVTDHQVMQEIANGLDIRISVELSTGLNSVFKSKEPKFSVDLYYKDEHVYVKPFDILEPRQCPTCYKRVSAWYHQCKPPPNWCHKCDIKYWKNHKCRPNRLQFVQNRRQQQICETKKRCYASGFSSEQTKNKIQRLTEGYYPHGELQHTRSDYNIYMPEAVTQIDADVIFYDMETFTDENNILRCYALRSRRGLDSQEFIGEDAVTDFLYYLGSIRPRVYSYKTKKDKTKEYTKPILLNAWNGSGFDHHILLQEIIGRREDKLGRIFDNIYISGLAISGGSIMRGFLTFREMEENNNIKGPHFCFHDSCLFIKSSLASACKEFGISSDNKKTFFPHKMITDYNIKKMAPTLEQLNDPNFYFSRDIPKSDYVENSVVFNPYTEEDLADYLNPDGYTYNLYRMCSEYLRRDVDSMYDIVKKFYTEVNTLWKCDLYQYVTISQFTYDMWWDFAGYKMNIINGTSETSQFIRQAVYGGRVYSTKRHYEGESNLAEMISIDKCYKIIDGLKFENLHKKDFNLEEGLVELDVTSLYPAAMQFNNYPVGVPIRLTPDTIESMNKKLKKDYETGKYLKNGYRVPLGVYQVSFRPNPFIIHPVLPIKSAQGTHYNLLPGRGIYTSVDLNMAIESQYLVEIEDGYEWLQQYPVFEEYIKEAYKMKEDGTREKNKVKRKTGKLLVNGLYGKTIQKPIETTINFCQSEEDITHSLKASYPTDVIFMGESSWLIEGKKFIINEPKPVQLGAFVLSYSRKIMYDFSNTLTKINFMDRSYMEECYLGYKMNPFDRTFHEIIHKSLEDTWWYSDTDSIYVRRNQRHLFNLDGELGNLKDESQDSGTLLHAVFLGKKNYGYVYLNKKNEIAVSLKTKGMDKSWLNMADYFTAYQKPNARNPLNLPKFHFRPRIVGNDESLRKNKINQKLEKLFTLEKTGLTRQFMKTLPCHRVYVDEDSLEARFDGNYSIPHGHVLDPYKEGERKYEEKLNEYHKDLKLDCYDGDEEELTQLLEEIDLECQRSSCIKTYDMLNVDTEDEYVSESDLSDFVVSDG